MTADTLSRGGIPPTGMRAAPVPALFEPVLERLAADVEAQFNGSVTLTPVAYQERPFSHLLRVAVIGSASGIAETHLYVKVFKAAGSTQEVQRISRRVEADFETTARIHEAMSRWGDLAAVRAVACYPEYLASVTEEAIGTTLLDYLQTRAAWRPAERCMTELAETMQRVGRWVRAFQASTPTGETLAVESLRAYVDVRLARLTTLPAAAFDDDDRRRVLAHIDRLAPAVDPIDLSAVPIHADLAPGNILVAAGRVTVLDFAMSSVGSRLHDLSRLFLQIELISLKPHVMAGVLRPLNRALLAGFDPELDTRRPMFRLLLLQHRINHLGTLSATRESFPASAYNWHVRRNHRAWITRELRRSEEDR